MQESWRVVLFTDVAPVTGFWAQYLAAKGHRLIAIVTSPKRNPGYIDVVRTAPANVEVIVSNRPRRWAGMLASLRPDLVVSAVFPWRIPDDVLDLPRLGAINLHPSLLPAYRGTMTPNWILMHGEREAGLTVHRTVSDFDTGPILSQVPIEVGEDDDFQALMQRIFSVVPQAVELAFERVARGDPGDPQPEEGASYYGFLPPELRLIDWERPARAIHNQVRAFSGAVFPTGAIGSLESQPVRVIRTRVRNEDAPDVPPGTVVSRDGERLVVRCGDGLLEILEHAPHDGSAIETRLTV